ncbi:MAG TPA: APC family permease [Chthonomonadaceae bacterium]|nr:APC family permease [Chthonomonadaceae bacterium]
MSLLDRILGKPLASSEEEEQKIGVFAGIPMLGLDGLSSAAYGPEAALTILIPMGALGLHYIGPITLVILGLLTILYLSYRQTIAAYPTGGGSYTVAKENLGTKAGLLAAAALLLDYILNVAVGISAGVGALVSAFPVLHPYILWLCLGILALIVFVNLRGVRESGLAFALPTYLFVGTLLITLVIGLVKTVISGGHPIAVEGPPVLPAATVGVGIWMLLRSFASGCTAMTGVEAVSNGVTAFAKPAVQNAQRTLTGIVVILGILLAGIVYLANVYHIGATDPDGKDYQSIISQLVSAVAGRGVFYYITIGSVLSVLALSANTSFAGFPRLCRLIASDDFLPHAFSNRGRRLVYTLGIAILTLLSALLLIIFGGITDRLIPLFAVGAFLAFTLSQAGMVVHWRKTGGKGAVPALIINAVGAVATGVALLIVLAAKFVEGAWITIVLIPGMLIVFDRVKRHYNHVDRELSCPRPMDLTDMRPPLVIVPFKTWSILTERGLHFALRLSPDVIAVHISTDEEHEEQLRTQWAQYVEKPIREANLPEPVLHIIDSPYRRLFNPLFQYINGVKEDFPDRQIAVIIPELVEAHWYEYLLHQQRATGLKAALLLRGDKRVVVINVPWYLGENAETKVMSSR